MNWKAWENQLISWHKEYYHRREALVWRNHPELRLVRGRWTPTGKGLPDFTGFVSMGEWGVPVGFDAKFIKDGPMPLTAVKPHQGEELNKVIEMGGIAFIAAHFKLTDQSVVIPWTDIRGRWEHKKRGSVGPGNGIPMTEHGWLDAALSDMGAA